MRDSEDALVSARGPVSPGSPKSMGNTNSSSLSAIVSASAPADVGAGDASVQELAKGSEALLARLVEVGSANEALLQQLEAQSREVKLLEESGRRQQQLIQEFDRRAQQELASEAAKALGRSVLLRSESAVEEANSRLEAAEREASSREQALREELDSVRETAQQEKQDLLDQLRRADRDREQLGGQLQGLESRVASSPSREQGLEMECGLLRSKYAKEVACREAAERALTESRAQQNHLKAGLDRSNAEVRQLRQRLAEVNETASFRQEVCNDLKRQLQAQRDDAERQLVRERTKLEHVARLEGVLPKHMLVKALL